MHSSPRREQIKLALALERQLPPHARSSLWPPDHDWHRFCLVAFRTRRAQTLGWSVALQSSLEQLDGVGKSLIQQVRAVTDLARNHATRRPRNGLRDILEDLEALEAEFPHVHWNRRDRTVSVITEPVILNGTELGPFEIMLEYRNLSLTRPYRVVALEPHPAAGDETTTHPHVRNEDLCEGDGRTPIQQALRQGRFYDLFILINQILHTYNKDSAYVPLTRWDGTSCAACHEIVGEDDLVTCEQCHAEACTECCHSCSKCDRCLCDTCQDRCATCGITFCGECLTTCSGCADEYCANCLENGRCEDCPLPDHDEECLTNEEDQAPEPTSAESQVHPLCLGQTPVPEGSGAD